MKRKTQSAIAFGIVVVLLIYIGFITYLRETERRKIHEKRAARPIKIHVPEPIQYKIPVREPEFRRPPIKVYKPGHVQQMGLLSGPNGQTLPLYGKETRGHRDRYNYYTSTSGEQIYSVPISRDGRDCMEDLGCQELYDNDKVSVTGSPYDVKMYRTDNFF
jgi:hypothetical protein